MGMIMNRFNMLMQLREDINRDNGFGHDCRRFILSGVVVHDINDHELLESMSSNFVKWAEMTGNSFLFITFVQPSTEWKYSKYCHDGYWIDKDVLMLDSHYSKEDEERTMPLLRDFMDLPKSGSYLMLTENLSSKSFYKIPISARTIENQFILIAKYCNEEASGTEHSPNDFKKLLRELKADEYSNKSSWLDILIDYTSVVSKGVNNEQDKIQFKHAKKVIDRLRNWLKSYNGEDFEDKLFHLFECLVVVYRKLNRYNLRFSHFHSIYIPRRSMECYEYLDEYSCKLLDTYNLLSEFILHRNPEDLDYSGLTLYMGKIVENELNLSIEQMLRHAMGIEMPKYYNKYCSRRRRVEIPTGNDNTINVNQYKSKFNQKDFAPLKSIPMGNLIYAYINIIENPDAVKPEPISGRLQILDEGIVEFFKGFSSSYRNPACHLDLNSLETYNCAKDAFESFLRYYLVQLYNIKITLQNPATNLNTPNSTDTEEICWV